MDPLAAQHEVKSYSCPDQLDDSRVHCNIEIVVHTLRVLHHPMYRVMEAIMFAEIGRRLEHKQQLHFTDHHEASVYPTLQA